MLINNLLDKAYSNYIYLERYVNDGSPSGFTDKFNVSTAYHPITGQKRFKLFQLKSPKDSTLIYPQIPNRFREYFYERGYYYIPIHPDVRFSFFKNINLKRQSFFVYPTSSSRTVSLKLKNESYFFKLHYDGIIGRVLRKLTKEKAIAGVEISQSLVGAFSNNIFNKSFSILRELFCIVANIGSEEIGFIFREGKSYPFTNDNLLMIPFFSLFSKDRFRKNDPLLLIQIINNYNNKLSILIDNIIYPLLFNYISMIKKLGLIPEINAQNILLEINENHFPVRLVLRDLMGIEKDLTIINNIGLSFDYIAKGYKTISLFDRKNYYIRHSFSYDFKLCQYVIDPLVEVFSEEYKIERKKVIKIVQEIFIELFGKERYDYFKPYNKWYAHNKVLLTNSRPYIEFNKPIYR